MLSIGKFAKSLGVSIQTLRNWDKEGKLKEIPIKSKVAAISVGKVRNEMLLDLEYEEDSKADVDMNIVMNDKGEFIELQGTGEEATFTHAELMKFIELSKNAFDKLFSL